MVATQGGSSGWVSDDGRFVAFTSCSDDVLPGDGNGTCDVFVRDLIQSTTQRVSVDAGGGDPDYSYLP